MSVLSHSQRICTLQIGNDWPSERVGGLNRYFVDLLKHLPSAGADVHGLVVGPASIAQETEGAVTPFARSNDPLPKRLWMARQAAREALDRRNVDLIVSHFAMYTAPLGALAEQRPLVVQFHGPWAAESHVEGSASLALRVKRVIEQRVYRRGKRFIVLSSAFRDELVRRYDVAEELINIIPGGIDIERFNVNVTRWEARTRLGWPTDRPIILAVRRLVRRMGLENLVDAMQAIVRRQPDVLLLLGGKGPISDELQARIEQHGLQNSVRLLGRIEEVDLPLAYRAADMTVVPSQALEGFGMITLESLASGTPVLVTPVGGLPEVVRPFAPACVFPGTSTQELTDVLIEVLGGQRNLPTEQACREYAVQQFAWPLIAKRIRNAYVDALERA